MDLPRRIELPWHTAASIVGGWQASLRFTQRLALATRSISARAVREWERLRTVATAVATALLLTSSTQWSPSLTPW